MNYWLGVVCRDHVRRGTELGIALSGDDFAAIRTAMLAPVAVTPS